MISLWSGGGGFHKGCNNTKFITKNWCMLVVQAKGGNDQSHARITEL